MRLFTPTPTTLATPTDVVFQYDDVDNKGALERERENGGGTEAEVGERPLMSSSCAFIFYY